MIDAREQVTTLEEWQEQSVACKKVEMGLNLEWLSFFTKVQISSIDGERMICCCHQKLEQS